MRSTRHTYRPHSVSTPVTEDQPVDVTFVDNEPLAYVDGESVAVLYDDDYGWGFWDGQHHWHHAPDQWRHRLDERFPHGAGISRHPETFVHQQAVAASTGHGGRSCRDRVCPVLRSRPSHDNRPSCHPAQLRRSRRRAVPCPNGASSFVQQHMSNQAVAARCWWRLWSIWRGTSGRRYGHDAHRRAREELQQEMLSGKYWTPTMAESTGSVRRCAWHWLTVSVRPANRPRGARACSCFWPCCIF
jgi:hypothetical protein